MSAHLARAQTSTWAGGGDADTRWSIGANWQGGLPPVSQDALVFEGIGKSVINDLASPFRVSGLTFLDGAGSFTLNSQDVGGNRLVLNSGGIVNASGQYQTIYLPVSFSASQTIDTGVGGIALHGDRNRTNVTGNPLTTFATITKAGSGELLLTGSSSYLNFTHTEGTLVIGSNEALGTGEGAGTLTIDAPSSIRGDGVTRTLSNDIVTGSTLTIAGASALNISGVIRRTSGVVGTVEVVVTNTAQTTFSGEIRLNQTTSVARGYQFTTSADSNVRITGQLVNGSARLEADAYFIKSGAGDLVLSGENTYGGRTEVNEGRLIVDLQDHSTGVLYTNEVLSSSVLAFSGGALEIKGRNTGISSQEAAGISLATQSGSQIVVNPNGGAGTTLTLGNDWTRSGTSARQGGILNIDISTPGAVVASNPELTHSILGYATVTDATGTGFLTVNEGNIARYADASALQASGNNSTTNYIFSPTEGNTSLVMTGGAKSANSLQIDTSASAGSLSMTSGRMSLTSNALLMTGSHDFVIQSGGELGFSGRELLVHQHGTGVLNIAASLSGGIGVLNKAGSGTLVLSGNSAYTGVTTVSAGTLLVDGTLATSAITVYGDAVLGGSGSFAGGVVLREGGSIQGTLTTGAISGSGSVDPGNSPGLLTATQVDPGQGLSFNFEMTEKNTAPDWGSLGNDVLRLSGLTPFTAGLTSENVVSLYLSADLFGSLAPGDYLQGGIYADAGNLLANTEDATFRFFIQDDGGTYIYNGQNYILGDVNAFLFSVVDNNHFSGDGQLMQFSAVPEPQSMVLALTGAGLLVAGAMRRRFSKVAGASSSQGPSDKEQDASDN